MREFLPPKLVPFHQFFSGMVLDLIAIGIDVEVAVRGANRAVAVYYLCCFEWW